MARTFVVLSFASIETKRFSVNTGDQRAKSHQTHPYRASRTVAISRAWSKRVTRRPPRWRPSMASTVGEAFGPLGWRGYAWAGTHAPLPHALFF